MARSARKDTHDTSPRNLGRYRLYGELAAGGMATVHLGRQIGSGGFSKMVAIKRLHPQFGKLEEFVEMFLAEARLAARIRHPNVVQPLDVLRVEDEVFLVMEYVEGDSLSRLMKATVARQEKVPLPVVIAILSGVLRGLHAAHEAKSDKGEPLEIVHRDVSPQNVLVGVDGTPRVIDFGIAKAADSVQVTREGELKGKLAYIAPEILNGRRGTRRADIYAAAVVLWEVLTAQRLFDADYQSAILANILHRPVDRPSDFVIDLPPAVDDVVMRGLARDPSDRFATAREMAVALEEAFPASSPAVVGEWVDVVAAQSLAKRGRRVAEIESQASYEDAGPEPEDVISQFVTVSSERTPARGLTPAPGSSSRPIRSPIKVTGFPDSPPLEPEPPEPPPPPPFPAPAPSQDAALVPPRSATPTNQPRPGARASLDLLQPPPSIVVDESVLVAPAWPVPGIAPAPMGATVTVGPKHRSSGGGIVIFMLLVALVATLLYVGLPEFLKRSYAIAAAREGVSLTVDAVEVGWRRVRLVGATASMAELPGVTVHAQSTDVFFSYRLDPTEAAAHEVLVSVDGTSSGLQESVRRVRLAHDFKSLRDGTLRQVAVDAGHVVWSRAFGEGTRVEAENITLDVERSGHDPLGDDLTFATPIVSVTTSWGKLGPWVMNGEMDRGQTKATLSLDPSGVSKAAATVSVDSGTVTALDLSLPRSNLATLGVTGALGGRRPNDPLFGEGEAHYALRSASRVEAMAKLSLNGARLANASGPGSTADAQFDLHVEGDPARPLEVAKSSWAFGPFRGGVSGSLAFGDLSLRADLVLRPSTTHCPTGGDASVNGAVAFDTRSLGDARLLVTPSVKCGLKIMPP